MGQLVGCAVVFCFTLFVVNYLKRYFAEKSKSRSGLFGFTLLDLYCHWLALKLFFGSSHGKTKYNIVDQLILNMWVIMKLAF